jgi:TM2 domain-containing membrane protein YozV/signal peptidase I
MKCPRCGLKNLDSVKTCVKCRYQLVGISLPENFSPEPPRAGRLQRFRKLYWKWRRSRRVILPEGDYDDKTPFWKRSMFKMFYCEEPLPGSLLAVVLSFLLPGSGQFILERYRRGMIFLIPSLLAVLIFISGILAYSIGTINLAASIYLIFQCISIFDAMPRIRAQGIGDLFMNLTVAALLWLGCFVSVNIAATRTVNYFWSGIEQRNLMYDYPEDCVFRRGDTVLIRPQETYARGDIVVYTCSMPYLYGNSPRWDNDYPGIDRIIALPGETVSIKDGIVFVDSRELENQQDLTVLKCKIPDMQWKLGENEYFIFTSVVQVRALLNVIAKSRKTTVIKHDRITGRITRITAPLERRRSL